MRFLLRIIALKYNTEKEAADVAKKRKKCKNMEI
jgi:hypothetical protein